MGKETSVGVTTAVVLLAVAATWITACGSGEREQASQKAKTEARAPAAPPTLDKGLLLALSQFEVTAAGKVLPKPGAALLEILTRRDGQWRMEKLEDPESNVFHKAMVYDPPNGDPGILTLGGNEAAIKIWRRTKDAQGFEQEVVWRAVFGGKHNRMRDAEVAPVFGTDASDIVVATHDQGVVAIVRPRTEGGFRTLEIDRQKDTFVHEIEIGDLDGDGELEIYATPSEPNRLDGTPQSGKVMRYVPEKRERHTLVADLGSRHAKEILVGDIDGDGRDELYVSVEGEMKGEVLEHPVEIRRYDAGTDPAKGLVIATIQDRLCRCLTAGDVDGDGNKEIVAAAFKSGLWLLRPGADTESGWSLTSIDRDSSGFEHASLLTDLDGDGVDELYVASDDQGELRRYVWSDGRFLRRTIYKRPIPGSVFTWNLMPVPVSLLR